jgi:hypothetical protein
LAFRRTCSWCTRFGAELVVEVVDAEGGLDLLDALVVGGDVALLLVDVVVDVAAEAAHDAGEGVVEVGGVGEAAADDERGAGLVDEDRVDLVDDGVGVPRCTLASVDSAMLSRR